MHFRHRLARGKWVAFLQNVFEPELDWVKTQRIGDDVHLGLMCPSHLADAITPKRRGRRTVGVHTIGIHAKVRNSVGSDSRVAAGDQIRRGIAIGTGVVIAISFDRHQGAIGFYSGLEPNPALMLHPEKKTFGASRHHTYRPPRLLGQQDRSRFQFAIELAAETATKRKNNHAHIGDGDFENSGELALDNVRVLATGPDSYPPVPDRRTRHMRLERKVIDGGRKKVVLENPIGITEAAGHVPFALLKKVNDVGAL